MSHFSEGLHKVILYTTEQKPLLEGNLRTLVEHCLKNLPTRYPGLKIVDHAVHPNRVEMTLDFQKLDEDVLRVVQSLKSEVKNLAQKKGFLGESLWQWNYEDQWVQAQQP